MSLQGHSTLGLAVRSYFSFRRGIYSAIASPVSPGVMLATCTPLNTCSAWPAQGRLRAQETEQSVCVCTCVCVFLRHTAPFLAREAFMDNIRSADRRLQGSLGLFTFTLQCACATEASAPPPKAPS